jgi:phosphate:Na+ symporter
MKTYTSYNWALCSAVCLALLPACGWAAAPDALPSKTHTNGIAWGVMIGSLFGGLALFLFGMDQMTEGLKSAAGEGLKVLLAKLTTTPLKGALTGALVTAVIQSSSITTVLVVGFTSAGLMSLTQSISVVMGANVGTTLSAHIIAFKVSTAALPMIAFGFFMLFISKRDRIRQVGMLIMGLGLIFYGMHIMSEAMEPLRSWEPFLTAMERMENPFAALAIGAVFTALIQSSSATIGIVIVMAGQGFITLETGIALSLGANIGTCFTAVLASIGKTRDAKRVAVVHVMFNVAGVALWIYFIPYLAQIAAGISPIKGDLTGVARMAAETPRQIANANMLFKLVNVCLFLPFTVPIAKLATLILPEKVTPANEPQKLTQYISDESLILPAVAIQTVRLEVRHMGKIVVEMLDDMRAAVTERNKRRVQKVLARDDEVDAIHAELLEFLSRLREEKLTKAESQEMVDLLSAVTWAESAGDVIERALALAALNTIKEEIEPSPRVARLMLVLFANVKQSLLDAFDSVPTRDEELARRVTDRKRKINGILREILQLQSERFADGDPTHPGNIRVETELMEGLKSLYLLAKRIARLSIPPETATVPFKAGT